MALSAHSEKSLGQKYLPSLEDQQEIIDLLRERRPITVMGIESSCDETGVGVVELSQASDGTAEVRVLANEIATSIYEHERFGGVVPEIASRAHLESMSQVMDRALNKVRETRPDFTKPDALATTIGPGLAGALMVGGSAAKGYAAAWEIPLYAVNHLGGHVAVDALSSPDSEDAQPRDLSHAIALLVSGGHTEILEVHGIGTPMRVLGSTYDDAAGEAYDKVARLMGLGYPGGPIIDRLAAQGDPSAIDFPRGLSKKSDPAYDFSFSGLKTAVARYIETAEKNGSTIPVEDLCASFQEAVADILTQKAVAACKDTGARVLLLGGGVSANHRLRELAQQRCDDAGIELHVPPLDLCTDNGVMIATLAAFLIDHGEKPSSLSVASDPSLDVSIPILH